MSENGGFVRKYAPVLFAVLYEVFFMTGGYFRRIAESRWALFALPLLLLPTLFLPLGNDQAIFARGGEFLFNGGVLYRDYMDQKPPLIFIFYGIAQTLLGRSDVGIRLFDLLWQTGTMLSLAYTIGALSGKRIYGLTAAALYGALYASMGHSETIQCETIASPAIVWLLYLSVSGNRNSLRTIVLRGALAGLCFAAKFPLGIMLPVLILWEYFENSDLRRRVRNISSILAGFIVGTVAGLSPLFNGETASGYLYVLEYTRDYVNMIPANVELLQLALKSTATFLGDNISLILVISMIAGILTVVSGDMPRNGDGGSKLLIFSSFILIALLASVMVERRFLPYHFTRSYVPFTIVATYGFLSVLSGVVRNYAYLSTQVKLLLITICVCGLLFSPLPRVVKNCRMSFFSVTDSAASAGLLQQENNPVLIAVDVRNTADFIRSRRQPGRTFVVAMNCSNTYRALDERPFSRFTLPVYYYARVIPKGAYDQMLDEVRQARWIVIQTNDVMPTLYGHNKSSWECVQGDMVLYPYLTEHFTRAAEFGALYVYERKGSAGR